MKVVVKKEFGVSVANLHVSWLDAIDVPKRPTE